LCDLVQDPDRDVREAGIGALGRICDKRALVPLVTALVDAERVVRNLAHATLRKLDNDWEQSERVRDALPAIQAALGHSDYWVRYSATQVLEQLKIDPEKLTEEVKAAAAKAKAAPPHVALPFLADLLFDRDRDLRVAAASVLGRLRERGAVTILAAAARDADHAVQQAAQAALAALN
jgi:HEAT repeat protein